jgi:hypothetical protein
MHTLDAGVAGIRVTPYTASIDTTQMVRDTEMNVKTKQEIEVETHLSQQGISQVGHSELFPLFCPPGTFSLTMVVDGKTNC